MDSFLLLKLILLAYAILAASRPFATITSLSELYLRIRRFFSLVQTKKVISLNYEKHKQLKTMEMNETWPDIFYEGYIHQFQPGSTHRISCATAEALNLKIFSHEASLNDDEETPNQRKSSQTLWDEMEHPTSKLTRSQWKLRQQHDENFQMEAKPL